MRRLIFIFLLISGITAKAQWTPIYGKQRFMQGLAIPYTDTTALKNISDTGCIVMGKDSSIYYRYKGPWKKLGSGSGATTDTTSLSNRIDLRVKYADTASMLSPYAKTAAVALKVNISDTASMLSPYAKSNAVALKVNIADTATMLSAYIRQTLPASPSPYVINTNGNYLFIGSYNSPFTSGRIDVDNTIAAIGTQTAGSFAGLKFTQLNGSAVFSNSGAIQMIPLTGTGTRMVVAGSTGILSTQTIPSGGSGTVTNVATGYGLSGGPITTTGTLQVDSATLSTKYLRITDTTGKWASATGYVPYVGATTDLDMGTHQVNAGSFYVTGTGGNGHVHLKHQSADATATGQSTVIYADANGDFKWKNAGNYYTTLKTSGNAANAIYTYPSATTTLIGAGDTSVFQRKSVSAYTIMANNTNAAANTTAQTFRDVAEQNMTNTISWVSGTAPTTLTSANYTWSQIGKTVTFQFNLLYVNAAAGITGFFFDLPADMPTPAVPTGWTAASAYLYVGACTAHSSAGSIGNTMTPSFIRRNAANTAYEIGMASGSSSARGYKLSLTYRAQ